jgi:hypothetical protein
LGGDRNSRPRARNEVFKLFLQTRTANNCEYGNGDASKHISEIVIATGYGRNEHQAIEYKYE